MNIVVAKLAKKEFSDAKLFYELEQRGLGFVFDIEIRKAISRINAFPNAWKKDNNGICYCLLHKFPYKILFSLEDNTILIIAFAHQHRQPDYWLNRIE